MQGQGAVLLLLLAALAAAVKLQMPLRRVQSARSAMIKSGEWPEYVKATRLAASLRGNQPVYDYTEAEYCVIITVGTPPQEFLGLLDTGSEHSWVPSTNCGHKPEYCDSYCKGTWCNILCEEECCVETTSHGCERKTKFDKKRSSTFIRSYGSFHLRTTLGKVEGSYAKDKWSVGNESVISLPNYRFGLVMSLGDGFRRMALDGVLGLGRSESEPKSFFVHAIESGLLDEPIVSLYLRDAGWDANGAVGGALTLGGVDNANCGLVLEFLPLLGAADWVVQGGGVQLAGVRANGGRTLLDTGTARLHGPAAAVAAFADAANATYDAAVDAFVVDCAAALTFTVTLGKHDYPVPSERLVRELDDGRCELAIKANAFGADYDWILGVPFAQTYCQIYDYTGRLGLALIDQAAH